MVCLPTRCPLPIDALLAEKEMCVRRLFRTTARVLPPAEMSGLLLGTARVGDAFIGQSGKIVHAGIERERKPAALLESQIPPAALELGIIALVDAGQQLHLNLRIAA